MYGPATRKAYRYSTVKRKPNYAGLAFFLWVFFPFICTPIAVYSIPVWGMIGAVWGVVTAVAILGAILYDVVYGEPGY